jgi:hypothetical protein
LDAVEAGTDVVPDPDAAGDGADATGDTAGEPFLFEVYTHSFPDGLSGIATGAFAEPAVEHDPIPVGPEFTHVLSFEMSPMLPPSRFAVDGHGPLVLFTDDLDTIVFSPLDHPFAALVRFREGQIRYGLHGDVADVPPGFTQRFLMVRGRGINATIAAWGARILADRGRAPVDRYADTGLSRLGYWTDNGAQYYYVLEPGMDASQTLLAVKADLDARGIPIGYLQLDSWWYFKEAGSGLLATGLVEWKPQPALFPEGLVAFQKALGLPMIAHNRWFAKANAYRDTYDFVEGQTMAFPTSGDVFEEFMDDAKSWGVFTYEQDWLWNQWDGVPWLRQAPDRAEQWMSWMSDAALARDMTMQICMPSPGHLLDAVDRRAVTTVRTSVDHMTPYAKEAFWPPFHTVNLIAAAIGIHPFKDNFHTTEFRAEGEALVSSLSAGMVGIGDALGKADAALVARTCTKDGLLLKPDRPATPIDAMFLENARPYTVSTFSDRAGLGRWTYLAAFNLGLEDPGRADEDRLWSALLYDARPLTDLFFLPTLVTDWHVDLAADLGIGGPVVAYDWRAGTAEVVEGSLPLPPIAGFADHDYLVLAPVLSNGMALLGETGKFVTVADRRFTDISPQEDAIAVTLSGVPGEVVTLRAYDADGKKLLDPVAVTIDGDGSAKATLAR